MEAIQTLRAMRTSDRTWSLRDAAIVLSAGAIDAVPAGIFLLPAAHLTPLEWLGAAVAHGSAVLLVSSLSGVRTSRLRLCVAAAIAIPLAGVAMAAAIAVTKGRGSAGVVRRARALGRRALAPTGAPGSALPPWDALHCGDEEARRDALSLLSRRTDPEAIVLLRRTAAGRDSDLALSAALVLDEIAERVERDLCRADHAEVRHGTG